jgi:hypothetical protein
MKSTRSNKKRQTNGRKEKGRKRVFDWSIAADQTDVTLGVRAVAYNNQILNYVQDTVSVSLSPILFLML